jgi:hypothetical protein
MVCAGGRFAEHLHRVFSRRPLDPSSSSRIFLVIQSECGFAARAIERRPAAKGTLNLCRNPHRIT